MHNLTRNEMLQRSYKDRRGVCVPYQERDIRYDVAHGYLRQEGGDQASKGGVLHRGPVGTRKRGRDGAEGEGRKRGRGQAAALPRDQGKAGRPTQTREKEQGEPGEDGETNTAAGAPGDTDPGTETSARYK